MSGQINAEYNDLINTMSYPLQECALPHLSTKDLASLRASCKVFNQVVMEDRTSRERVDFQSRLEFAEDWAPDRSLSFNGRLFGYFKMQTILNAGKWLRTEGDVVIPPNGLGVYCLQAMCVGGYISRMQEPHGIYYHLWKVKGSPEGDKQYGEKAFYNRGGLQSTAIEKAEACERFVVESYARANPYNNLKNWESHESLYAMQSFANQFLKYPAGGYAQFTMQTMLHLATWMRNAGGTQIPPYGIGVFTSSQLSPDDYVLALHSDTDRDEIFYHLWKVKGSPEGIAQYGEKAFLGEDGLESTYAEKAEAIERFIIENYLLSQPSRIAIRLGATHDFQKKLHYVKEWASQETVKVNPEFLNPSDPQQECPRGVTPHFTMQTVLAAAIWLRKKGDTPVPPHGLGIFQPNELSAFSYILGMDNLEGIYNQLWKVKGSPQGVDARYGEKVFLGIDGFQSSDKEKAEACERFVLQSYLNH